MGSGNGTGIQVYIAQFFFMYTIYFYTSKIYAILFMSGVKTVDAT